MRELVGYEILDIIGIFRHVFPGSIIMRVEVLSLNCFWQIGLDGKLKKNEFCFIWNFNIDKVAKGIWWIS